MTKPTLTERLNAYAEEQKRKGAIARAALDEARAVRGTEAPSRAEKAPVQPRPQRGKFRGEDGTLAFAGGNLRYSGRGRHVVPVAGVREVRIEDGAEFRRRSTLARTGGGAVVGGLFFGPVGLLAGLGLGAVATKAEGGEKFLTVETDTAAFAVEIPRKQVAEAQAFAADLRSASKVAA